MRKTREQVLALVREFRDRLAGIYGSRLKGVYLYGAYARGEATADSDIDVAVVLAGPVHRWEEDKRTDDLIGNLSLREDCILMPLFLSEEEYARAPYAVFRDILRERVGV